MENYEEKYKQALKRAKTILELTDNPEEANGYVFTIFPELRESEDEKWRKWLIGHLRGYINQTDAKYAEVCKNAISWLEKQGKQKPVEQDTEIRDLWVYIREWNDKFGRLPKDEDELASCIDYVMKRQKQLSWSEKHIADVFEKVGLAKIVREQGNDQLTNAVQSAMIELSKHQNPAWSEEDEKKIMWLVRLISTAGFRELDNDKMPCSKGELIDWLKSLKPNHWKPNEQNIKDLEWCADLVQDKLGVGFHRLQVFIDELKNI